MPVSALLRAILRSMLPFDFESKSLNQFLNFQRLHHDTGERLLPLRDGLRMRRFCRLRIHRTTGSDQYEAVRPTERFVSRRKSIYIGLSFFVLIVPLISDYRLL